MFIRGNKISYVDMVNVASVAGLNAPAGAAMQLAGIKKLHVTHNVMELNPLRKLRTFRCGAARFFNNSRWDGEVIPGWRAESDSYYDEPETLAESEEPESWPYELR